MHAKMKLLVCLCAYGVVVSGKSFFDGAVMSATNSVNEAGDESISISFDFGKNGPDLSYVDLEGALIPSWEMVDLWVTNRIEYIQQQRRLLEQEKMKALADIAKIADKDELCEYLNQCPVDPFAKKIIVPLQCYRTWLFAKRTRPWENYLIRKAKEHAYFSAVDMHGHIVSGNPRCYAALDAYEAPTEDDLIRWLRTDPRIERGAPSPLLMSFRFRHFSDSFYQELTRDIIVNWTNLYIRGLAVQVLRDLDGGDTELEKIKKEYSLPGDLLPVIDNSLSMDPLTVRWQGMAPLCNDADGTK